jgi:Mrp family chromosome partitioning ATPase
MDTSPVILALPPIKSSPVAVSLAQSADSVVLCISMEHMRLTDAKKTIDAIGRDHFVGAVTFT